LQKFLLLCNSRLDGGLNHALCSAVKAAHIKHTHSDCQLPQHVYSDAKNCQQMHQHHNMSCAGYVPPHSRRGDGTSTASSFSLSGDSNGPGGKLGVARGRALPPGAAPPDTKAASKNSKRRSKKKGSGAGADDTTTPDDALEQHTNGTSSSG